MLNTSRILLCNTRIAPFFMWDALRIIIGDHSCHQGFKWLSSKGKVDGHLSHKFSYNCYVWLFFTLRVHVGGWFYCSNQLKANDSCGRETQSVWILIITHKGTRMQNRKVKTVMISTIHSPELDLSVISSRYDQWHCRMKRNPVHTTIMALGK